jgi:hypothetical protein
MSDDIDIVVGKLKRRDIAAKPKSRRSSYSAQTAEMVKPILDKLLENPKDIFVPCGGTGYSVNTLYVKINDGLKWLMNNDSVDGNTYRLLRTQICIRKLEEGCLVYFKEGLKALRQQDLTAKELDIATNDSIKWRHDVLTWLQSAQPDEVFARENIAISDDDKRWVYDTLADMAPEAEAVFSDIKITIIR